MCAQRSAVALELDRAKDSAKAARIENRGAAEALGMLQSIAVDVQQRLHDRIASVVSRCLEAVFDEPYEFRILFVQARGRTEARLVFIRDEVEVNPTKAAGGGVVDVAAFALRLACLTYHQPKLRPLLVLDEPFRFVSEEYRDRCRDLVETLAHEMGVQFVIVTHLKEFEIGKVVRL